MVFLKYVVFWTMATVGERERERERGREGARGGERGREGARGGERGREGENLDRQGQDGFRKFVQTALKRLRIQVASCATRSS